MESKEKDGLFKGEKPVLEDLTVLNFTLGKSVPCDWEMRVPCLLMGLARVGDTGLGQEKAASSKVTLTCFLYLGIALPK